MDIREAVEQGRGGKWFRPVSWRGSGEALVVYCGHRIAIVPSLTGGQAWYPKVSDFTCDWEVVDPDTVLDEVK